MTAAVLKIPFADGTYPFRLGAGEARELQRITDCGPLELYRRLLAGNWRVDDVTETIRLGLIGARKKGHRALVRDVEVEITDSKAIALVAQYVETFGAPHIDPDGEATAEEGAPMPWTYSSLIAAQILAAMLMGSADEPLGKKPAGEEESDPSSRTAGSDGEQSSPDSQTEA